MRKRNLYGQALVCAAFLCVGSTAWAVPPGDAGPATWLRTLYAQVVEWWQPAEAEAGERESAGHKFGEGQVMTMDGSPMCDPGTPDPGTERGCHSDPDG